METIIINPFECLGVSKTETNLQNIKRAYIQKKNVLDPELTDGLTHLEFNNLNKSYLVVKKYLEQTSKPFLPQHPTKLASALPPPIVTKSYKSHNAPGDSRYKGYNSILGYNFDPQQSYNETVNNISQSTNYKEVLEANKKATHLDNSLSNISSFDSAFDFNVAPIIDDGHDMFVHDAAVTDTSYFNNVNFQDQREYNSNPVSTRDLQAFSRNRSINQEGDKISKNQFRNQISKMEDDFNNNLNLEQQRRREIIQQHQQR
jgi:hypothetical protein